MSRFGAIAMALSLILIAGLIAVFILASGSGSPDAADSTSTTVAAATSAGVLDPTAPGTTTTTSSTTSPATSPAQPTVPPFQSAISTVTATDLSASWSPGCPVEVDQLRLVTVSHWGYDGVAAVGEIVVAADLALGVIEIFEELYDDGFPIERMELVEAYDGDDNASMAANNTSAFNCRPVTGGSSYSEHSYGRAIDINPVVNPYVNGDTVLPAAGQPYVDRTLDSPGMIHAGDEVVEAFAGRGWIWGGIWTSLKDYQHFSTTGN